MSTMVSKVVTILDEHWALIEDLVATAEGEDENLNGLSDQVKAGAVVVPTGMDAADRPIWVAIP